MDSGIFERRKNDELQRLYKSPNIWQFISSKKIEWTVRVRRQMDAHEKSYDRKVKLKKTTRNTTPEID